MWTPQITEQAHPTSSLLSPKAPLPANCHLQGLSCRAMQGKLELLSCLNQTHSSARATCNISCSPQIMVEQKTLM